MYHRTKIREWRQARGLTQEQLGGRIGMSGASISRLETGHQAYTQPVLEAIADALNCTPPDLLMRLPPGENDRPLWDVIQDLEPDKKRQAARILKALAEDGEAA